jgi:hypothetical protein
MEVGTIIASKELPQLVLDATFLAPLLFPTAYHLSVDEPC